MFLSWLLGQGQARFRLLFSLAVGVHQSCSSPENAARLLRAAPVELIPASQRLEALRPSLDQSLKFEPDDPELFLLKALRSTAEDDLDTLKYLLWFPPQSPNPPVQQLYRLKDPSHPAARFFQTCENKVETKQFLDGIEDVHSSPGSVVTAANFENAVNVGGANVDEEDPLRRLFVTELGMSYDVGKKLIQTWGSRGFVLKPACGELRYD